MTFAFLLALAASPALAGECRWHDGRPSSMRMRAHNLHTARPMPSPEHQHVCYKLAASPSQPSCVWGVIVGLSDSATTTRPPNSQVARCWPGPHA